MEGLPSDREPFGKGALWFRLIPRCTDWEIRSSKMPLAKVPFSERTRIIGSPSQADSAGQSGLIRAGIRDADVPHVQPHDCQTIPILHLRDERRPVGTLPAWFSFNRFMLIAVPACRIAVRARGEATGARSVCQCATPF